MKGLLNILGPLGLVLTLIGGITYGILYSSGWVAVVPLVVGLALIAVSAVIHFRSTRTSGSKRSAQFGISAAVSIVALAAILVFLQTILSRHSVQYDMTTNRRFSLSSQTVKILDGLRQDVAVTCFFKEASAEKTVLQDLLKQYASENPRVKYVFVDPDRSPLSARRYKVKNYGTVIVECGSNEERTMEIDEEKITNAIVKVTRDKKKIIYCLVGHGEKSISDTQANGLSELKTAVAAESYEIRDLLTLRDSIPRECAILMIPGPEKDVFLQERSMIERYLGAGGTVLLLIDPVTDLPQIDSLASAYGIEVTKSMIVDRFGKLLAGNYLTPVVNEYGNHPITDGFRMASFFPQARALTVSKNKPRGTDVQILCSTGTSAYAETNIGDILKGTTTYEEGTDLAGPVSVAIVAAKEVPGAAVPGEAANKARHSRLVVFGDSDFASNAYLNLAGNKDLMLNTIGWLAEEEDLIAVRAKDQVSQPVILNVRQGRVVFWLPVIGLPAVFAVIGIIVLVAKRRTA
jgi:ABC-type uncharacterized transport system involved in gliding motility auxiliary subunit